MANETSNKIVVIGAGNVGETICYTLMLRAQVGEIVLVDVNEDRAKGAALDISHGTAFYSGCSPEAGSDPSGACEGKYRSGKKHCEEHHEVRKESADYRGIQPGRREYLSDSEGNRPVSGAGYRNRNFSGYRAFPLSLKPARERRYP